jgi:hypothetical protein
LKQKKPKVSKRNMSEASLANLTYGQHGFTKGNDAWKKSAETRRELGQLRKITLENLEKGEMELPFKKIRLYKRVETSAGVFQNIEVEAEFDFGVCILPNMNSVSVKIIELAMKGEVEFMKMLIEFDENYKNRQIDIQNKAENTKENLIDHIQRLTVMPIIKDDDDEIPDYDSLNRQAE